MRLQQQAAPAEPGGVSVLGRRRPAEVDGPGRVGDVEDDGAEIPVREVGARPGGVRHDRMRQVAVERSPDVRERLQAELLPRAPRADLHRRTRVGDVPDPEVGPPGGDAVRGVERLRAQARREDERAAACLRQPELVRAARVEVDAGQLQWPRGPRDVVEGEPAPVGEAAALDADRGEVARVRRRADRADDRLLRPGSRDPAEGCEEPRSARVRERVRADALGFAAVAAAMARTGTRRRGTPRRRRCSRLRAARGPAPPSAPRPPGRSRRPAPRRPRRRAARGRRRRGAKASTRQAEARTCPIR